MTKNYQTLPISPDFFITVVKTLEKKRLSDVEVEQINQNWRQETAKNPQLFNGLLLSMISYNDTCLLGEFVEYKDYIAQMTCLKLKEKLKIIPVSISCIGITDNEVLFGKRGDSVATFPHWHELVPSGGVDSDSLKGNRVDIKELVLKELNEETGISPFYVESVSPKSIIIDSFTEGIELAVLIRIKEEGVKATLSSNWEYESLKWIPKHQAFAYMKNLDNVVPLSKHLLDIYLR